MANKTIIEIILNRIDSFLGKNKMKLSLTFHSKQNKIRQNYLKKVKTLCIYQKDETKISMKDKFK